MWEGEEWVGALTAVVLWIAMAAVRNAAHAGGSEHFGQNRYRAAS